MEVPHENDDNGGWVEVGSKKKPEKPNTGSSKAKKGNNKRLRENNPNPRKNGKIDRPSSSLSEPNYKTRSMRTVTPSLESAVSVVTDITANMSKMSMDDSAEDAGISESMAVAVESDPSPKTEGVPPLELFSLQDFHFLCSSISPETCLLQTLSTRGLINTKSECFRNCILQSLFSLPIFRNVITHLQNRFPSLQTAFDEQGITYWKEFLRFSKSFFIDPTVQNQGLKVHQTRLTSNISASEQMPNLCTAFDILMSQYNPSTNASQKGKGRDRKRSGIQQDSMEFLTFFLDCLHEELLTLSLHHQQQQGSESEGEKSTSNSTFLTSEQSQFLSRLQRIGHHDTTHDNTENNTWNTVTRKTRVSMKLQVDESSRIRAGQEIFSTLISRLFHGLLRSEVSYKTKRIVSVTFQRFHCLSLDCLNPVGLNPAGSGLNPGSDLQLETVLNHYFSEENVDDLQTIKKCVKFEYLPSILVLQLNRFSFDYSRNIAIKVNTHVTYPNQLEILSSYMSDSLAMTYDSSNKRCMYQLQSVVLHIGKKATGGHYISYIRDSSSTTGTRWKAVDDIKVNTISEEFALSASATVYILFYTKIEEEFHQEAAAAGVEEKERS